MQDSLTKENFLIYQKTQFNQDNCCINAKTLQTKCSMIYVYAVSMQVWLLHVCLAFDNILKKIQTNTTVF